MQLKHVKLIDKYRICQLEVYESSREAHITFCTPESRNAIGEFLSFRERLGEKLTLDTPRIEFETQLVESNRPDQKPKEQIERILNVILNDQEQVRAIGASYFKKKLQEGKSKNKFHRVNILGSELSQGICSVCQRVCDQQCGECMKYFCEVHIKEHASAHR